MSAIEAARLVVKDYVRREDVDKVAERERWVFRKEAPAGDKKPYQKIWLTPDKQVGVTYLEDTIINVRAIEVRSTDLEPSLRRVSSLIDVYNSAEIQGLVNTAQTPEQWITAIHKAAMAAPREFDPEYFKMFERAFEHPDPRVRRAAIESAAYAKWREFEKPLENLDKNDPQVGRDSAIMLQAMRTYHWREQPKA